MHKKILICPNVLPLCQVGSAIRNNDAEIYKE